MRKHRLLLIMALALFTRPLNALEVIIDPYKDLSQMTGPILYDYTAQMNGPIIEETLSEDYPNESINNDLFNEAFNQGFSIGLNICRSSSNDY